MKSKKEISALHQQMCLDYTTRMEKMHRNHACSRPVAQCLEYIYDHLHNRCLLYTSHNMNGLCELLEMLFEFYRKED